MIAIFAGDAVGFRAIFAKWFSFPALILLAPIPVKTAATILGTWVFLRRMPRQDHGWMSCPSSAR